MDKLYDFIFENWKTIITFLGIVITWLSTRKRDRADILSKIQDVYNKMTDDIDKQYNGFTIKIKEMEARERIAIEERGRLLEKIEALEKQTEKDNEVIKSLKKRVEEQDRKIKNYELKIKDYEAQMRHLTNELKK